MVYLKTKKGFTLIEALVAIFITSLLLVGLLYGLILSRDLSLRNILRNEAVKIANEYVEKYRNTPLSDIPPSETTTVIRKIGNNEVNFTVNITSNTTTGGLLKELTVSVNWSYKGKNYTHTVKTLIGEI